MERNCVRCGVRLIENEILWCRVCIDRVDEELRGEISRPYEYYFRNYIKQRRKAGDLFGQVGEFGSGKTLNWMLRGS